MQCFDPVEGLEVKENGFNVVIRQVAQVACEEKLIQVFITSHLQWTNVAFLLIYRKVCDRSNEND